jgi:hypothetical protein
MLHVIQIYYYFLLLLIIIYWVFSFGVYSLPLQISDCFELTRVNFDEKSFGKKNVFPQFQRTELRQMFKQLSTLNFTKPVMFTLVLATFFGNVLDVTRKGKVYMFTQFK